MNADEARAALDAVTNAECSVAAASAAPMWRHFAFAFLLALVILSAAIDHRLRLVPWIFSMAGMVLLLQWDRRQTGMFANGYRRGRTLPLTIVLLIVITGLAFAAIRLNDLGEPMLALLTVPAASGVALLASLKWERIFLAELGAGR